MRELRKANQDRADAWPGADHIDLPFRGNELAGEAGELCNFLKKKHRLDNGIGGGAGKLTGEQLLKLIGEELADVIICTDLIAMDLGIDLWPEIVSKFNKTSTKVGVPVFMELNHE